MDENQWTWRQVAARLNTALLERLVDADGKGKKPGKSDIQPKDIEAARSVEDGEVMSDEQAGKLGRKYQLCMSRLTGLLLPEWILGGLRGGTLPGEEFAQQERTWLAIMRVHNPAYSMEIEDDDRDEDDGRDAVDDDTDDC